MKAYTKYLCFYLVILSCMFSFPLKADTKKAISKEEMQRFYQRQDKPNIASNNPLKGLSEYLFFSSYPSAEKIFEKYGKVKKSQIIVQTDKGEAIDLSPFALGVSLIYEIYNLMDFNGKPTGFVRASLNLDTAVEIEKSKNRCSPYIWSSNCFLKGSTKKGVEKLVAQALNILLEEFMTDYSSINSSKPVFDLQTI